MRRSISSATSPLARAAGAENDTSSPPLRRWLFGRAAPSTSTAPSPTSRSATAREPISGSPARKRSSRSPAASSGTRRRATSARHALCREERAEKDGNADDDEAVGEIERRPVTQVDEVGHVTETHAIEQ